MKKVLLIAILLLALSAEAQNDVVYHVFQRSYFDSDGDGHGDLNGINTKLDYLQDLGVTTLLLTPLYLSDFYHNYFADDFERIDPEYGTMDDYLTLVKEIHRRKMKVYQDVEMQYVTGQHEWFTSSYQNPNSVFDGYVLYNDNQNTQPYWFFNVPEFTMYNGRKQQIIMVDMHSKAVRDYTYKVLSFWVDPNSDGDFSDGVDGFRLDHMMDDLDNAGKLTNLFRDFWKPLLTDIKTINPKIRIVAEQANWASYGHDYFEKAGVDYVFAFRLKFAVDKFDKSEIMKAADSTFLHNPTGRDQFVFLENHDTRRFASEKGMTIHRSKAAAVIQLLIGGIPSLYYGQEIGMKGVQQSFGMTDGNDIPVREAFDWYAGGTGPGMARWYKDSGPWWDKRSEMPNDGISFEEQDQDATSLLNHYRALLKLRAEHAVLQTGKYRHIDNDNENVVTFERYIGRSTFLVAVNLSDTPQIWKARTKGAGYKSVLGEKNFIKKDRSIGSELPPFGFTVLMNGK